MTEIEVEEKPKSYIGKNTRILKDDIDKLHKCHGFRMFSLSNDTKPYIAAIIEQMAQNVESREKSLNEAKAELKAWEALLRKENEGK